MKKTIIINNLEDVIEGDILFITGRSDGFRVAYTQTNSLLFPIAVDNPFNDGVAYVRENMFDHAERTIDEPEWPHPEDLDLHIYLGSDGVKYFYTPASESDQLPWSMFPSFDYSPGWWSTNDLASARHEALPLTELKLVPKEEAYERGRNVEPTEAEIKAVVRAMYSRHPVDWESVDWESDEDYARSLLEAARNAVTE